MTDEKKDNAQTAKTAIKVIVGILLICIGAGLIWLWRWDVRVLVKGCLGMIVLLAGVIFLAIAKE